MSTAGVLLLIAAPSGTGKTSLVNALVARQPGVHVSVSHTTRPRRNGEIDGRNYHFVSSDQFVEMVAANSFLEHARVFGHNYGTSRKDVTGELECGHDVVLEIDWQGARQIRTEFPHAPSVFILPPSRATLLERLRGRGLDDEAVIRRRTVASIDDMSHFKEFDYVLVNDDFDTAVAELEAILIAHRQGREAPHPDHDSLIAELLSSDGAIE
jgi:guanylate kinase